MSEIPMCIFQCESFQVYQMNIQNAQPVSVNLPQTPADTRTEHSGDVPCQGDLQSLIRDLAIGEDLLGRLKVLLPHSLTYHWDWRPCRSQESCFHLCRVRSHISLGKSVPGEITSRCNHHSQVACKSYVLVHIWKDPWISELLIFKLEFSQEICELCRAAGHIAGSSCVLPTQLFF